MIEALHGRAGRARGGGPWRAALALLVYAGVSAGAAIAGTAEASAREVDFEGHCLERDAWFRTALEVDLFGDHVVGRFDTSNDERFLAVLAVPHQSFERVAEEVDGFAVAGDRLVAWGGDPGRLLLVDAADPIRPHLLWQGTIDPRAEPRAAAGGVWWLTEVEGSPRVAWAEAPPGRSEEASAPRFSPPLEVTEDFSLVFSDHAALLQTASLERAWLWQRKGAWKTVELPAGLEVVDAAGSSFVAWDAETEEWRFAEASREKLVWRSPSWPELERQAAARARFYGDRQGIRATFAEADGPSTLRLTHVGLGRGARVVSVEVDGDPSRAAFDGRSLAVLRRGPDRPALRLCSPDLLASAGQPREAPAIPEEPAEVARALPTTSVEPGAGATARARALGWMRAQVGPVLDFDGREGRLIDSYEDDRRAGWVYDAALAVMVFSASGEQEIARQLLVGLESLQHADGSWSFAFHPDRGLPLESERYVGSIAWVVMAANFYEWQTGDRSFSRMALEALRFIARFQSNDPTAREFGGVAMGPGRKDEFSAEHNADAYSAFLWRGRLEKDGELVKTAGEIRRFVFSTLWAEATQGEGRRYFKVGSRDATLYLDPQTWLTLSLGVGADDRSSQLLRDALRWAVHHLQVERGSSGNVVVGFNEASGPDIGVKIWPEGTEGMVAALRIIGDHDKADFYHQQTARLQTASGGIPYATANEDGWSTRPAVAGTAWFLLNELRRNPFHPGETTESGVVARGGVRGGRE